MKNIAYCKLLTYIPLVMLIIIISSFSKLYAADFEQQGKHSHFSVLADYKVEKEKIALILTVKITPDAGWHTYWHNPGDSGMPLSLEVATSEKHNAGDLVFPPPKVFSEGELITYGYEQSSVIYYPISVVNNKKNIQLDVMADWLVCKVDCVPEQMNFSLDLPTDTVPFQTSNYSFADESLHEIKNEKPILGHFYEENELLHVSFPLKDVATFFENIYLFVDQASIIDNVKNQKFSIKDEKLTIHLKKDELFNGINGNLTGTISVTQDQATTYKKFSISETNHSEMTVLFAR